MKKVAKKPVKCRLPKDAVKRDGSVIFSAEKAKSITDKNISKIEQEKNRKIKSLLAEVFIVVNNKILNAVNFPDECEPYVVQLGPSDHMIFNSVKWTQTDCDLFTDTISILINKLGEAGYSVYDHQDQVGGTFVGWYVSWDGNKK